MSKLSYENRIDIYEKRKKGVSISALCSQYNVRHEVIEYLIRLIDKHGYDVLRKGKNKQYTCFEKEQIVNRILLNNESICSVAIDEGLLSYGMLQNWIQIYKENGYNMVERKRGRRQPMKKIKKEVQKETDKEKIERLEKENEYLKAELEYSKKLRAVVQLRKSLQQKKK